MASPALEIKVDEAQLASLAAAFGAIGKNFPAALARAVNHAGDKAKTQMTRALVSQTGLQRRTIVKALRVTKASQGTLSYTIRSRGGNISLKYFGARETAAGVSAAPRGARQVYAGSFMKGGRFPQRVTIAKFNGQVMARDGGGRTPLHKVKSGVFIPEEMVSGASGAAFQDAVERDLPAPLPARRVCYLPTATCRPPGPARLWRRARSVRARSGFSIPPPAVPGRVRAGSSRRSFCAGHRPVRSTRSAG